MFHVHIVYYLRVGKCLHCEDLLLGPDEGLWRAASPPTSFCSCHIVSAWKLQKVIVWIVFCMQ